MGEPKNLPDSGPGNTTWGKPRQDRRLTRKMRRRMNRNGTLSAAQLNKLRSVINSSVNNNTFNKKDSKVLNRFIENLKSDGMGTSVIDSIPKMRIANDLAGTAKGDPKYNPFTDLVKDNLKNPKKDTMTGGNTEIIKKHGGKKGGKGDGHKHGGKNGGGKNGGPGKGLNTSTPGMPMPDFGTFPGVSRKDARIAVGQDINKFIRELMREAQSRKNSHQFDINKANALFDRTEGDLDHVYGEVAEQNQRSGNLINQGYNNGRNAMEQIYGALQGQMQGTTDANRDAAMAEMERLGIQQSGMGRFNTDANFGQQVAGINQANTLANLGMMQNSSNEIGNMLASMGQASLASAVGRATNDRNDYIQDSRQAHRQEMSDILGQIRDTRGERHSMVNELHQAMEQNAYQRWAETNQQQFNNVLAANNFNLGVSKHNSSNLLARAKLTQEAARQRALKKQQNRQWQMLQNQTKKIDSGLADIWNLS